MRIALALVPAGMRTLGEASIRTDFVPPKAAPEQWRWVADGFRRSD